MKSLTKNCLNKCEREISKYRGAHNYKKVLVLPDSSLITEESEFKPTIEKYLVEHEHYDLDFIISFKVNRTKKIICAYLIPISEAG